MKIARLLYPVHVLGPGERIAIWTYGCIHNCRGCISPELQKTAKAVETDAVKLRRMLDVFRERGRIDGITISGGDPFYDADSLLELLTIAQEYSADILVYTGYLYEELQKQEKYDTVWDKIAVLIDGPYMEAENNGHILKGSDNQKIYFFKHGYQEKYEEYCREYQGRYPTENFQSKNGIISVGIHRPKGQI